LRDGDRGHWIPFLEWMVTTSCDLACPGCDRFIDHNHNWTEDFDLLKERMTAWSKHLDPDNLTIIGGEPLIHPRIYDILATANKYFNHATIELFTNGLLLPKKPKLYKKLKNLDCDVKICISYHNRQSEIRNLIDSNIEKYFFRKDNWRLIGNKTWKAGSVTIEISDMTEGGWYDYRKVVNNKLKPWNENNPESSYRNCEVNKIPIVYDGLIYKCPPISMLQTHAKKYGLDNDTDWHPYLKYKGLSANCSELELEKFIENIYQPHSICNMCPAKPVLKPQKEAVVKHNLEKLLKK
jgi:MoaA/NifB/PqqE/SkfB family radical SAM enzyme